MDIVVITVVFLVGLLIGALAVFGLWVIVALKEGEN